MTGPQLAVPPTGTLVGVHAIGVADSLLSLIATAFNAVLPSLLTAKL